MKNDGPIPIPTRLHWHEFRLRLLPAVVFVAAIIVIAFLWDGHVAAPTLVGQAEAQLAAVSSHKPGLLTGLAVTRFQTVKAGDTIGHVIVAEPQVLESSLAVIHSEIEMLRVNLSPVVDQQRNAINYVQLRLNWMQSRADLASNRVKLQLAEAEWHRADELFKSKLVSESERDIAKSAYDALQNLVNELAKMIADGEKSLAGMQTAGSTDFTHGADDALRASIAVQEAKLKLTEAELNPITLKAPIDGVVTEILHMSGEAVTAGQPIVSIASTKPMRIVGYLRPPLFNEPLAGDRVEVRTRGRHRVTVSAQILGVGAELEIVPAVFGGMARLDLAQQGLPLSISLPNNLSLHPGELLDITLLPKAK